MEGRYELKYVIKGEKREKFLRLAKHGLIADPHGENAVYRVSSVYFDTPDFAAYWEKLDGEGVRRKYRLRYYSPAAAELKIGPAFMEIKHRIQNTVYKQRVRLTHEGALAILDDARLLTRLSEFVDERFEADAAAIADVELAASFGLEAKTTISYLREAWMGSVDDRLRLTFDSHGQAHSPDLFANVDANSGRQFMADHQIVMEVKFNQSIPYWIRDALIKEGLVLQRFSKYAAGVETPANEYLKSMTRTAEPMTTGLS